MLEVFSVSLPPGRVRVKLLSDGAQAKAYSLSHLVLFPVSGQ